jgi:hypothetical protein
VPIYRTYSPDRSGEYLTNDLMKISLAKDFYFAASHDPLDFRTNAVNANDPGYQFFKAVRLKEDTVLEGIRRSTLSYLPWSPMGYFSDEDKYEIYVDTRRHYAPAGSLVLRSFRKAGGTGEYEWSVLTHEQTKYSNPARICLKPEDIESGGHNHITTYNAVSISHDADIFKHSWLDKGQIKAHADDIKWVDKNIKNKKWYDGILSLK